MGAYPCGRPSLRPPLRLYFTLALIALLLLIPVIAVAWTAIHANASSPDPFNLPRVHRAAALYGPSSGGHGPSITPTSARPGGQFPGGAGHASRQAGRVVLSPRRVHGNSAFAANVVVASDTTPAPFGPEPRNGPQAAVDPTNANHIVVVYNDYTTAGQGGVSTVGYAVSTDGGASWSASQLVHGLLKIDGGAYEGADDPGIAFDTAGNAYLTVTTFDTGDWATAIYVAVMPASSSQFGAPVQVAAFNDTHRVVEYARITPGLASGSLYLTFNALGATPQTPDSTLAAAWTSQLYATSSQDGGQAWAAPVAIGAGQQDYWGVPVVDWNGTVFVFYSGALGLEMVQSGNGGQAWSSPRSLEPINAVGEQRAYNEVFINPGPAAAVDAGSQALYVVYNGGQTIVSSDDGATWSQPIDVLGNHYSPAFLASISVDPTTHIVSVGGYSTAGDPGQNTFAYYYAQSADGGSHFSSPALVSDNASLPPAPAFGSIGRASSVVSGGHFAHLFWTDTNGVNGNEEILSASLDVSQPLMGALQGSWDSTQALPPWGIVFTGAGSQAIGVGNYGQGSIGALTATVCGSCSWLSASVSAGSAAGTWVVTVSTSSAATSQVGSVTIQASGLNSSITIPVQLQIELANPAFSLGTSALTFTTMLSIDPPTQAVQVTSLRSINEKLQVNTNGDPALSAAFPDGSPAVVLNPGVSSGLIVLLSVAGLSTGTSTHSLTVSDGTTSLAVTITLTITAAPAQLDDPASSLNFAYHQQGAQTPAPQTITLHNSGGSTLHWQGSSDASWLSLDTTSGSIAPGASQQVNVSVRVAGLSLGTSIGYILLGGDAHALNLPETIPVYMVVDPPAGQIAKTWYFAEGYVSSSFAEYLTLENPNARAASVQVTYLTQPINQAPRPPFTLTYRVGPNSRYTVSINSQPGIVQNDQVSLVVSSNLPVVAERPMYFKYTPLSPNPTGGTDIVGATHLNTTFFFPFVQLGSDAQSGSPTFGTTYSTYLTVLNQNSAPVHVSLSYQGAGSLYTVTHTIAASSRGTISLASDFPLASSANHNSYLYAVSLLVMTDLPVVVELPSYFTIPHSALLAFATGTDEIGSSNPQASWDFAEGYTGAPGAPFLTYLDLANFGDVASQATLTLLVTGAGNTHTTQSYQFNIGPQSSSSVLLNTLVCPSSNRYCGDAVAAHVQATQPLVVDRQMYFNYGGHIAGATAVVGSPSGPQSIFYFAEGYTGQNFSAYLTLVNPGTNTAIETVTIRYLMQGGSSKTVTIAHLPPGQRWTENVNSDVGPGKSVSVIVSVNVGSLLVERPMYFHYQTLAFGGSDVIGYVPGA
jgi:hypothetical protein